MIWLDNYPYSVYQNQYRHNQKKYASVAVSNTGIPVHVDSGVFHNLYQITLICTREEIEVLRGSFAKAAFTNSLLPFTDEEGHSWLPTAGTDTADTTYNSGVWMDGELNPQPLTVRGWSDQNRFQVPIELYVNASGLSDGGGVGSGGGNVNLIHELPGGVINGTNDTFMLTQTPVTLILFKNGAEQVLSTNYTLSGQTITFLAGSIPQSGDYLDAYYTV